MKNFKSINLAALVVAFLMVWPFISLAQDKHLTDPEIASIAVTANQIDIDYAAVAKAKY